MVVRVAHVITTLDVGGAEVLLARHLQHLDRTRFAPAVLCLRGRGEVGHDIEALGIPVASLDMGRRALVLGDLHRARGWMSTFRPDVVQTWMYHADLIGGLAARSAGVRALAWGIHQSDLRADSIRRSTRAVARANARLSRWVPRAVVCSSEASRRLHEAQGYPGDRMHVIRNGFPQSTARSDARSWLREELRIPTETVLVGRIGRFHAQKDHATFAAAARRVAAAVPDVAFVLCGEAVDGSNTQLGAMFGGPELDGRIHLLGLRRDVADIHAGLDVAVSSSSFGETFPLVIGEAMAAGVPVVTTDVGDCAELVGGTGAVVAPEDPAALADAVVRMVTAPPSERQALGDRARQRVTERFSLAAMTRRYEELHERLAETSER